MHPEHRYKNSKQTFGKSNATIHKEDNVWVYQVEFIPGMQCWFNIRKSVSAIPHINLKWKPYYHFNRHRRKFQNSTWFFKKLSKLGTEEYFLNLTENIYEKLTSDITFNSERLNIFLLRKEVRAVCSHHSIQHFTRNPCQYNQARKVNKRNPDCKKRTQAVFVL